MEFPLLPITTNGRAWTALLDTGAISFVKGSVWFEARTKEEVLEREY